MLNIEWGQIDPKDHRRVKASLKLRLYNSSYIHPYSISAVPAKINYYLTPHKKINTKKWFSKWVFKSIS